MAMELFQSSACNPSLTTDITPAILAPDRAASLEASLPTNRSSSITFIDKSAPDYQSLHQGLHPGTEVYLLDSAQNAISQITQTLAGRSGISSLNIVTHGKAGSLDFSSLPLDQLRLTQYTSQIQSWRQALAQDADILLYGCNIAQGLKGEAFVQQLSQLTGADVAASNNLTGNAKLGGDWELEYYTGSIEAPGIFEPWAQAAYEHVLATFAVTNTNDSGVGSLRQAILDANSFAGSDEIVFSLRGNGAKTITLTSGQLGITDDLFISGLGQNKLTISGNQASRVFEVNSGVNVTMRDLTITNGYSIYGGGIRNGGRLDARNITFKNNEGLNGGAIMNGVFDSDNSAVSLTVDNVKFIDNSSSFGAAINNIATVTIRRSTFSDNTSHSWGGAILSQGLRTVLVESSIFERNSAGSGGGIATGGRLTVRNSTFKDNRAIDGGGGISTISSFATIAVEGSTFSGNTAERGGGIRNSGTLTINDSQFKNNIAAIYGGGIHNEGSTAISYSTFQSNTATVNGGAIYNNSIFSEESLQLEYSTLEDNQATSGGGIFNMTGRILRVKESKIRSNTATGMGPNLNGTFISEGGNQIGDPTGSTGFVDGTLSDRVDAPAENPVVPLNPDAALDSENNLQALPTAIAPLEVSHHPEPVLTLNAGVIEDVPVSVSQATRPTGFSQTGDQVGTRQRPIDPKLGSLEDYNGSLYTMIPQWGSAAINAGDPMLMTERDQNGLSRSQQGRPDIGAVEWINQAPIAMNDIVTFSRRSVTFNPLANDFDQEGQSFVITEYSNPDSGRLTRNANGTFTYTANSSIPLLFPITTSFTYTIMDEMGATSTARVTLSRQP